MLWNATQPKSKLVKKKMAFFSFNVCGNLWKREQHVRDWEHKVSSSSDQVF